MQGSATSLAVPLPVTNWRPAADASLREAASAALEGGHILLLPDLRFPLEAAEEGYRRPDAVKAGTKTIKYEPRTGRVWGMADSAAADTLRGMMKRYAEAAHSLVLALFVVY